MKRAFWIVLVSVLCTAVSLASLAAPKKRGKPASKRGKTEKVSDAGAPAADKVERERARDAGAPAAEVTPPSNLKESKQTDGGSSYKFGELEIEGRLKTPQIVYFLRRVRAEFAAQDLGHRSFKGELRETRKEPSF